MSEFELVLFGGPRLRSSDGDVPLTPYQACLLTLVAAHGRRGVTRRTVMDLFWEEHTRPDIRHRLRQLLHDTRGRTRQPILGGADADPLVLDAKLVRTDLERYQELHEPGRLRAAAELLERGFAPLLDPLPGPSFDDWLTGRRRALRRRFEERARSGWVGGRDSSRWLEARDAAEALFVLNPADPEIARCAMEARAMTDGPAEAEQVFLRHRTHLPQPDTIDPEVQALRLRLQDLAARHSRMNLPPKPTPLVGRQKILEDIEDRLERVRDGTLQLMLLTGSGGIGKTRILHEVGKRAGVMGFTVLRAQPVQMEHRLPLNALADALGDMDVARQVTGLGEPWRTLIAGFLPFDARVPTLPEVPPIQESGLSRRLLDAFSLLLQALVRDGPVLLCIDDLQWADDTTLAVLQFVSRRWEGAGALGIVGTARPPEESGRRWPSPYLNELMRLADSREVVGELEEDEARSLIRLTSGSPIQEDQEERLLALGGRNPFFLVELTKDHIAGRLLLPVRPGEPPPLPISLQELFENRLAVLSSNAKSVAETLAIRDRSMAMSELSMVARLTLEDTAEAVEELLQRSFAGVEDGAVSIGHELFRRAFYRRVSPAILAVRHLRIAQHLESVEGEPAHGEIAVHLARGGEAGAAARHGRIAVDQAVERGAIADAIHLLRVVVDNEPDSTRRAVAHSDLGRLLHVSRDMERAAPVLEQASAQLRLVGLRSAALRLDIRRMESLVEVSDLEIHEAVERLHVIKSKAETEEDWVAIAMALDTELHLLHQIGDVEGIQELFGDMTHCTESGDQEAACLAHAGLAMNILFGDPQEGLTAARRAVEIAESEGLKEHLLKAQTRLLLVLVYRGESHFEEGQSLVRRARERAQTSGDVALRFFLESSIGVAALDRGALRLAEDAFHEAKKLLSALGNDSIKVNLVYNQGELALAMGDPAHAKDLFATGIAMLGTRPFGEMPSLLQAGTGLSEIELGRLHAAKEVASRIQPVLPLWTFDSSPVLDLRTRILQRKRAMNQAIDAATEIGRQLRGRLPVAWVKTIVILLRNAHAAGVLGDFTEEAASAAALADRLSLTELGHDLARFQSRLAGDR